MNSNTSIAVNGMGKVSIGNISIGNTLGHLNRRVIYSENMHNHWNFQKRDYAKCAVCHRKEKGQEMQIAGVGAQHVGDRCSKNAWTLAKV